MYVACCNIYIEDILDIQHTVLFSGVPRNFVRGDSTNSVEDRGQRERGYGGGSPIVRGFLN